MNAEFQSMNPSQTDDSHLLRFEDPLDSITRCILIDCGDGVTVDDHLGENDELVGIVITHAHEDHIASLPNNARSGVPIYTTPDTATVLKTLFEEAAETGTGDTLTSTDTWAFWNSITPTVTETVTDALTPITEFTQITPNIDICPLPAGHTPGAASFLFKILNGNDDKYLLATGDFTTHAVGTNPGLTTDIARSVNIDVVMINSPERNNDDYTEVFSESVGSMLEHAVQGKKVLVSASSLTGVHYAYWTGKLAQASAAPVNITLAGLTAKLYRDLGYDDTGIDLVPEYAPEDIVDNGNIVITAPEVPESGGSGEIYNHLKNDANSTIIQIKSGGDTPNPQLTIDESYRYVPHPTQDEIDAFIESLNPIHTIVAHGPKKKYKGRFPFTIHWTVTNHHQKNQFFRKGSFCEPSWVSRSAAGRIQRKNASRQQMTPSPTGESGLPTVDTAATTLDEARISEAELPNTISIDTPLSELDDAGEQAKAREESTTQSPPDKENESSATDASTDVDTESSVGDQSPSEPTSPVDPTPKAPTATDTTQTGDTLVTASDGGATAAPAIPTDPSVFSDLPNETARALLTTFQEVHSTLTDQRTAGTVVKTTEHTVTIELTDTTTESLEKGDAVTLLDEQADH